MMQERQAIAAAYTAYSPKSISVAAKLADAERSLIHC